MILVQKNTNTDYLNLMRVIASFLVILTHVAAGMVYSYKEDDFPAFYY